jgi:methionyl-tRNA formyltransferase
LIKNVVNQLNIAIFTKGERGLKVLLELIKNDAKPVLVFSQDADEQVLQLCKTNSIIFHDETKINLDAIKVILLSLNVNIVLLAGYSKLIKSDYIDLFEFGILNCHGGKLPEYRGASPIPWQIINGEQDGCCYILKLTQGIDTGPILAHTTYPIKMSDNASTLTTHVSQLIATMFVEVIIDIMKGRRIREFKQKEIGAVHWTRRYEEDGLIDWKNNNASVLNLIRALTPPYPGAFTFLNGSKIIINKASQNTKIVKGIPGRYVGRAVNGVIVCTGETSIVLEEIVLDKKTINPIELRLPYGTDFNAKMHN